MNSNNVPAFALVVQSIWTAILCLTGTYGQLLNYVIFAALYRRRPVQRRESGRGRDEARARGAADVQVRRPEVSASLAAVIDRATAKDLHERYRSDEELIADLEDVLALETARTGSATGEATTCCARCPRAAPARPAARALAPGWLALAALLAVVALVAGIVLLGTHAPRHRHREARRRRRDDAGRLGRDAGARLRPDRRRRRARRADRVRDRRRPVDRLDDRVLHDRRPAEGRRRHRDRRRAGRGLPRAARPHAHARLRGRGLRRRRRRRCRRVAGRGWRLVARSLSVERTQTIDLDTAGQRARWVLLWITRLPPDDDRVEISELSLYR